MSTPTPVSRIHLRDPYDLEGKSTSRYLDEAEYVMAYEADTDKMVIRRRGGLKGHVIPWANIIGFEIARPGPVAQEAANGRPAPNGGTGGGPRRTRTAQ